MSSELDLVATPAFDVGDAAPPPAVASDAPAMEAALEEAQHQWQDPYAESRNTPPLAWDSGKERAERGAEASPVATSTVQPVEAPAAEPVTEALPVEAQAAETVLPTTPPPALQEDKVDRLASLVEKLLQPRPAAEAPQPQSPLDEAQAAVDRFGVDAQYRDWVLQQLGYQPERLSDAELPHAYRIAETYLERRVEKAEREALRAEVANFKREQAEQAAQQAAAAREKAVDAEIANAFKPYGPVPAKVREFFTRAVKGAVSQGTASTDAIRSIFDSFQELLPKAAPPTPQAPKPPSPRDRQVAAPPRSRPVRGGVVTDSDLQALEGGRWR